MIEQVKELADKAGFYVEGDKIFSDDCFDSIDCELTNFANLIIQECIEQVKLELRNHGQLLSNPPQNAGVWDACNNIRRRFGVK